MSKYMGFELYEEKNFERFSAENSILFNTQKTICIKFGSKVWEGGLSWIAQIYYGLIMLFTLVILYK